MKLRYPSCNQTFWLLMMTFSVRSLICCRTPNSDVPPAPREPGASLPRLPRLPYRSVQPSDLCLTAGLLSSPSVPGPGGGAAAPAPAERDSALPADKQIDLSTADLRKLRVKELRRILDDWGETCKGCAEKSDFIRRIHELMPKYAPRAAGARSDL